MLKKLSKLIEYIAIFCLSLMLIITFSQVVLRYVFNSPLVWAEQLTLFLLIWFGFMMVAVCVGRDEHIALEFFYSRIKKKYQILFDKIKYILYLFLSIFMIVYGLALAKLVKNQYLTATKIPKSILYFVLVISGILIILYSLNNLIRVQKNNKYRH